MELMSLWCRFCLQRFDTKFSWSLFSNFPNHWSQLCPNLIQYCHNNIHWPHFRHFCSLVLTRKSILEIQSSTKSNVWALFWAVNFAMINEGKNGPALPWILISDYEKRARLKTPCLGDINASNFTPKKWILWKGSKQMRNL